MEECLAQLPRKLFRFVSNAKSAVAILSSLAVVLAAATILESRYDTATARYYIYDTWWFSALLGLLGANVFFAALSRWPWRRHHIGFLVTHLGILILLYGSLITLFGAYEGKVVLAEGESVERMALGEDRIFLVDSAAGKSHELPVNLRFQGPRPGRPVQWKAADDLELEIVDYLPHAEAVLQVTEEIGPMNPALEVTLEGSQARVKEWLFSRQEERRRLKLGPAFVTFLELQDPLSLGKWIQNPARGELLAADGPDIPDIPADLGSGDNELILARLPDGSLQYAIRAGGKWKQGDYEGKPIATGWMDFRFQIARHLAHASAQTMYRRLPFRPGMEGASPAIRAVLRRAGATRELWLKRGEEKLLLLGNKRLHAAYGPKSLPLGFEIKLHDFHLGTYEGTKAPAAFESLVSLPGSENFSQGSHKIHMNHPLKYGRYKIFQSSYQTNPSGPDLSVLAVAYDPGIPFKYAGALVMVSGVILMFFFRSAYAKRRIAAAHGAGKEVAVMKSAVKVAMVLLAMFAFVPAQAASWPEPKAGMSFTALQEIVILEGGRKKPLDSFARETARKVTGKERFASFTPVELLLSWLTQTKEWESLPILEASYLPLQKHVGLKVEEGRVSPAQLRSNQEFLLLAQAAATAQRDGLKPSELEKNAANLMLRLSLFYEVASGRALTLIPRKEGTWEDLAQLAERYPNPGALGQDAEAKLAAKVQEMLEAYHRHDQGSFGTISLMLKDQLKTQGQGIGNYPNDGEIRRELHFNAVKPFLWAWITYALAFFLLLMSLWVKGRWLYRAGLILMAGAIAWQGYGFFLRCLISGRAPVTNMYETVIWVSLGVAVFAMIFELIYRPKYYALAGSALATLGLILAGSSPAILDPTIVPLVPVLRDNFWLTVHVLTITLSYAAFALALGVGNLSLGNYIFSPRATERSERLNYFLYRAMQVGVVLLAAGTILGGVWANASWGRFWGWDPKEVWALIALLGYLIILHGRYAGWLKGFGLAVGSILAFLLVLMAWYGVNFILGVGLHSYGFSSGGASFVSAFVTCEVLWIAFAVIRYKHAPLAVTRTGN